MRTQDITRGITSRHCRTAGGSPELGRIIRMRGDDPLDSGHRVRRSRRPGGGSHGKLPLGWTILLGAGSVAVFFAAVGIWVMPHLRSEPAQVLAFPSEIHGPERIESRFPSPSEREAIELVKAALANRDPGKVEALFRTGGAKPEEIIAFMKANAAREKSIRQYRWVSSMDVEHLLLEGVIVSSEGADGPCQKMAFLTPDENGVWKMDFESYASVCKPSWASLLRDESASGLVRVKVEKAPYYNSHFSNDKQWTAYKLTCPDQEESLWAYCEAGTELAASLEELFYNNPQFCRATLEVSRVPGAEKRQVKILRLLSGEWVVPSVAVLSP